VHKSRAIKFYTVVTNIFRSSLWTLLRITDPVHRILRWFLHFWKVYTSFAIASIITRIVLDSMPVQGYCLRGQRKCWCFSSFYAKHYSIIFILILYSICIAASGLRVANFVICLATGTSQSFTTSSTKKEIFFL
jgi:hypothetical protein